MHRVLLKWFRTNKRDLPWRLNRDPYRIWISETMLQQTTTTAVIPYFERFVQIFPTLQHLARAPEKKVLEAWAGLGYYSRARHLHKAARQLRALGEFPRSYQQLLKLPGFGPYTSRAVASIAFGEPVGVVDGNVIRVLSRYYAKHWEWWRPAVREQIQELADSWCQDLPSHEVNQGMMELGRVICTPKSPACPMCPLRLKCRALQTGRTEAFPIAKPRRPKQIWWWRPELHWRQGRLALVRNSRLPFLKGQWLLPGKGQAAAKPPAHFHYRHSITHYDIFVTVESNPPRLKTQDLQWIAVEEIRQHVPASLVLKALRPHGDTRGLRHERREVRAHPG